MCSELEFMHGGANETTGEDVMDSRRRQIATLLFAMEFIVISRIGRETVWWGGYYVMCE